MNLDNGTPSRRRYAWPTCLTLMLTAASAAVYLLSSSGGRWLWILALMFVSACPVLAALVYWKFGRGPGA